MAYDTTYKFWDKNDCDKKYPKKLKHLRESSPEAYLLLDAKPSEKVFYFEKPARISSNGENVKSDPLSPCIKKSFHGGSFNVEFNTNPITQPIRPYGIWSLCSDCLLLSHFSPSPSQTGLSPDLWTCKSYFHSTPEPLHGWSRHTEHCIGIRTRASALRNNEDPERNWLKIRTAWAPSKVCRSQDSNPACWVNSAWILESYFLIHPGNVDLKHHHTFDMETMWDTFSQAQQTTVGGHAAFFIPLSC